MQTYCGDIVKTLLTQISWSNHLAIVSKEKHMGGQVMDALTVLNQLCMGFTLFGMIYLIKCFRCKDD